MTTAMFAVEGLVCESCKAAVLDNVHALSGVTVATMDLVTGGGSPLLVSSGTKLGAGTVRDVVGQVGFGVRSPRGPAVPDGRGNLATAHRDSPPDREQVVSSMRGVRA